ncbi:cobalamin biosynthesis protein [uncultured Tateyamaria sp.]|uniref:cobalamin biosynthesis protein n=1 Tax=uncultured Tateyamaria sp. TaxID=455651 RepID=UPI00262C135A|nr:cobalamin biosynthesis protein [uncultured Tateyamaria sp.]
MIVAGFGFSTQATTDSFADALAQHADAPDALATLAEKADSLTAFAKSMNLTVIAVTQHQAAGQTTRTQSVRSSAEKGTPSVAEATALAAAGPGARLISTRSISQDRMATCAIAEGPDT